MMSSSRSQDLFHSLPAQTIRMLCRTGRFVSPTAGFCPNQVQANLLILPANLAPDFRRFCLRNPVCCPLLGQSSAPGDKTIPEHLRTNPDATDECSDLGDVTTDAPSYNVYRDGNFICSKPGCREEWDDMVAPVAFFIGCSFSFEAALVDAGLVPRHIEQGINVSMYRTRIPLMPAGVFSGHMVVSMRPYPRDQVEVVRKITSRFVKTHGEPIAWGYEAATRLGIDFLEKPDFGDKVEILDGEIPVFWGCGVTPQLAVMESGIQGLVVSHTPGSMLCLDIHPDAVCDILM